jgi:hypothetical protein
MNNLGAGEAKVSGKAGRISAADKEAARLQAAPAALRATIHVTRKATGKVETYTIVGTPLPEQPKGG